MHNTQPNHVTTPFQQILQELRKAKDWTYESLSETTSITIERLKDILEGYCDHLTMEEYLSIATAYRLNFDDAWELVQKTNEQPLPNLQSVVEKNHIPVFV